MAQAVEHDAQHPLLAAPVPAGPERALRGADQQRSDVAEVDVVADRAGPLPGRMTSAPTCTQLAERLLAGLVSNSADYLDDDLWAEDVVIEVPFAPAGTSRRIEGRARFFALARHGREALPVRFAEARNVTVHRTTDPAVAVIEYELAGTVTTTGLPASASFIGVLTARDGRIARWREYQDTPAIARALAGEAP